MASKAVLLSLAALPLAQAETVLGLYIFSRHGDRTPKALKPTNLTSLGAEQVYASGSWYRSQYVASDAETPLLSLSSNIVNLEQMAVTAPPMDNVLQNSAMAFLQGLYPPAGDFSTQELRNDTEVTAPLGGYQYIPVNVVSTAASGANSENSAWLQGASGCDNAVVSSNNYLASTEYKTAYDNSEAFFQDLLPVINGTFEASAANFKNAYSIYDYVDGAVVHNQTIPSSDLLTNETLHELKVLANEHEWGLAYNSTDEIRAIAGSTLAGQILDALNGTVAGRGAKPLNIQFGAYAVFLSFFGLAKLPALSDDFTGVVNYASSMAFELVTNASVSDGFPGADDISVRFRFSNGSAASITPSVFPLFGQDETLLPYNTFVSEMSKFAIKDTPHWCKVCGVTTGDCATASSGSDGEGSGSGSATASNNKSNISLPVAGVIGALVTLAVVLGAEALIYFFSGLTLAKKSTLAAAQAAAAGNKA
ncbi:putative histidine acid phosphatase [Xylaria bambusicola]|uniref:putative histidine acid phosphatase n=1 Tax=Xylaria bambusicola TaxID=326684 RepID=UPI0020088864|nr:putative histidine acid phosphatase [Xylaria bambusicola]KAI0526127.1 putative histidine acid phosphatase [Xylaria bambusicola]